MQFIEDNVKFIVDETELRKENNTTSALYLDKKYYPCVVLSESGEFLPFFFVYNSFSRFYLSSLPFSMVNSCKGSPKTVACISVYCIPSRWVMKGKSEEYGLSDCVKKGNWILTLFCLNSIFQ